MTLSHTQSRLTDYHEIPHKICFKNALELLNRNSKKVHAFCGVCSKTQIRRIKHYRFNKTVKAVNIVKNIYNPLFVTDIKCIALAENTVLFSDRFCRRLRAFAVSRGYKNIVALFREALGAGKAASDRAACYKYCFIPTVLLFII